MGKYIRPSVSSSSDCLAVSCLVCRSRKVRCDGNEPQCDNCIRLGVNCPGYSDVRLPSKERVKIANDIYRASGVVKRRIGACVACRTAKHRCSRTKPCQRCLNRNLQCVYDTAGEDGTLPQTDTSVSVASPQFSQSDGMTASLCYQAYFERVHHLRCLCFVHKPAFMLSADQGTLSDDYDAALLDVMQALGSRQFSSEIEGPDSDRMLSRSSELFSQSHQRVLLNMHNTTCDLLMATILLAEYAARSGQFALAFVLGGCAHRQLRLLGYEGVAELGPDSDLVDDERRVRVTWACYALDVRLSSGVDRNAAWRDEAPGLPLPCSDAHITDQDPAVAKTLRYVLIDMNLLRTLDGSAVLVVLMDLRKKVLR